MRVQRRQPVKSLRRRARFQTEGSMVHVGAVGNRVMMKDGQMMEGKDGSKLMMKNNAIWKQITEQGALRPDR